MDPVLSADSGSCAGLDRSHFLWRLCWSLSKLSDTESAFKHGCLCRVWTCCPEHKTPTNEAKVTFHQFIQTTRKLRVVATAFTHYAFISPVFTSALVKAVVYEKRQVTDR